MTKSKGLQIGVVVPAFVTARYHYNSMIGQAYVCFLHFKENIILRDG